MREQGVVIFGGKGTAINVAEQIEDARRRYGYPMRVIGFAIDDPGVGGQVAGFPVVAGVRDAWGRLAETDAMFIFALYRPDLMAARLALLFDLGIPTERFANFIHPDAYISRTVNIGCGNVIMSQTSVQHDVSIGNFNILNSNVVVEHNSCIDDGVFLAASVCVGSNVRIGTSSFVGLNATIRESVMIAERSFVGMGACVVNSVDSETMVYGVPARRA